MLQLAAIFALLLSAPVAAGQEGVDPVVVGLAARLQPRVGQRTSGGIGLTGVHGEGRILFMDIDIAAGAPPSVGPPQIASMMTAGICAERGALGFFTEGRMVRFQVTRAGRRDETVTVDHCPPGSGQGLTAATFATGMQSLVGLREDNMTITAIRAERDLMIVTLAVPEGTESSAAGLGELFLQSFCQSPEVRTVFFQNGLGLRVELVVGGAPPTSSCEVSIGCSSGPGRAD